MCSATSARLDLSRALSGPSEPASSAARAWNRWSSGGPIDRSRIACWLSCRNRAISLPALSRTRLYRHRISRRVWGVRGWSWAQVMISSTASGLLLLPLMFGMLVLLTLGADTSTIAASALTAIVGFGMGFLLQNTLLITQNSVALCGTW